MRGGTIDVHIGHLHGSGSSTSRTSGLWFGSLHQDLAAYVQSTQRFVSGVVRMKLSHGHCSIVGRKSDHSLYNHSLATYDSGDQFDHNAALGFIKLWGLPLTTQAQAQLLPSTGFEGNLLQGTDTKLPQVR